MPWAPGIYLALTLAPDNLVLQETFNYICTKNYDLMKKSTKLLAELEDWRWHTVLQFKKKKKRNRTWKTFVCSGQAESAFMEMLEFHCKCSSVLEDAIEDVCLEFFHSFSRDKPEDSLCVKPNQCLPGSEQHTYTMLVSCFPRRNGWRMEWKEYAPWPVGPSDYPPESSCMTESSHGLDQQPMRNIFPFLPQGPWGSAQLGSAKGTELSLNPGALFLPTAHTTKYMSLFGS